MRDVSGWATVVGHSRLPATTGSLDPHEIAKQAEIERKTRRACRRRRPDDRLVSSEPGIHGGREQPQLEDHHNQHEEQHAVDDDRALVAREGTLGRYAHVVRPSTPTA